MLIVSATLKKLLAISEIVTMLNPFDIKVPSTNLRTLQVIATALPLGATLFLLVVVGLTLGNGKVLSQEFDIMTIVLFGQLIVVMGAYAIVPSTVAKTAVNKELSNAELEKEVIKESSPVTMRLVGIYQTSMIIGSALIEGIALFATIVVLSERSVWALSIACVMNLILFLRFPTESRVQIWMLQMIEFVGSHKQMNGRS